MPQIEALCRKRKVKELYAFGSVADDDRFNAESDVDLTAAFIEDELVPDLFEKFELHINLETLLERKVDLISLDTIQNRFTLQPIRQKHKMVYSAVTLLELSIAESIRLNAEELAETLQEDGIKDPSLLAGTRSLIICRISNCLKRLQFHNSKLTFTDSQRIHVFAKHAVSQLQNPDIHEVTNMSAFCSTITLGEAKYFIKKYEPSQGMNFSNAQQNSQNSTVIIHAQNHH